MSKRIHFIGICGVAMSALAIAFKKACWRVTGSDAGFFPPISTYLKNHEIDFYPGWHPELMTLRHGSGQASAPDLVVVGNVASSSNPEWMYVQEHKLNFKSYPEVVAEYIIKKNSIVCAGTYGKTTTSALLAWILSEAGYDPSYMFGGLAIDRTPPSPSPIKGGIIEEKKEQKNFALQNFSVLQKSPSPCRGGQGGVSMDSAKITDSQWSVVEGDEYKSARWDMRPKFAHYAPTHLLLTSVIWDHADVYPTEESYMQAFRDLVASLPKDGHIVACIDTPAVRNLMTNNQLSILNYGASDEADYQYKNIRQTKNGISFDLLYNNKTEHIESPMLGDYQASNITGAFAMAHEIGIPVEKIIAAIKTFPGLKRRLEKRYEGTITVFDDIAHSPAKAQATLATLRSICSGKIIAIFEPNTGNRQRSSAPSYDHAFDAADEVIIPELTKIKHDTQDMENTYNGAELAEVIAKTHPNAHYIHDDGILISSIADETKTDDAVIFLGSHGFRGMIEKLIDIIRDKR